MVKIDAAFETGVKVGNLRQGRDLFTQYTKKRRSTSKKASISSNKLHCSAVDLPQFIVRRKPVKKRTTFRRNSDTYRIQPLRFGAQRIADPRRVWVKMSHS